MSLDPKHKNFAKILEDFPFTHSPSNGTFSVMLNYNETELLSRFN
jgi:hypothetical protein